MLREGVTVRESGAAFLPHAGQDKAYHSPKAGDDFDKAAVPPCSRRTPTELPNRPKPYPNPAAVKSRYKGKSCKTTPADNTLQRMVDREAKRAEGKGVGYDRWAAKHNLKQMAATVTAYQQYGFSSPEELDEACSAAYAAMQESLAWLEAGGKDAEREKELQRQVLAYSKTLSGTG